MCVVGDTIGSIDVGVDTEVAINRTGLFPLGNESVNGTINHLCALGRITDATQMSDTNLDPVGQLVFFLYDETAFKLRRLVVQQYLAGEVVCLEPDGDNNRISDSELLFVYIQPRCDTINSPAGDEVHVCPLLINFENEGNMTTPYYNAYGSTTVEFDDIQRPQTFRRVIAAEPQNTQTFLNFNVSIRPGNYCSYILS